MKMRAKRTLRQYRLSEEAFTALYESQNGCCAICGISEPELEQKFNGPDDWANDRMLHIDHDQDSSPVRVPGLLCRDCNFDLEAYIRNAPVIHPRMRGLSLPRKDPRFAKYLEGR